MKSYPPASSAGAGRRGMSILVALIIVSILLMLASAGLKISSDESEVTNYDLYAMQAYCSAESGVMHASATLAGDSAFSGKVEGTIEVTLDGEKPPENDEKAVSRYEAAVSPASAGGGGAIVSTGFYMGVKRVLRAEIESRSPLKIQKYRELFE